MKKTETMWPAAPLASGCISPCIPVTFSMEKKVITAEQYRDWQLIAASLRKKTNGERS
ncbi:hypothetical protein RIG37_004893 [Escherichia coli]|uniref:hypothetical protein n=1 Tax=Escherichia TaxID=561 RepID=UPI00145ED1C8|nr:MULTISPECIES: hypothetical protein [Escherichia]EEV8182856.1 hypothetical protein [Escherichia coli]EEW0911378.1 hypothetical protein [Escherichia coli]EEX9998781.1 hypothetical protein [Escherichia coli]EEY0695698.1 hypothetical protein [Escherichia coli]EHR9326269.1 hypothetical protein [Escherichia coli]